MRVRQSKTSLENGASDLRDLEIQLSGACPNGKTLRQEGSSAKKAADRASLTSLSADNAPSRIQRLAYLSIPVSMKK